MLYTVYLGGSGDDSGRAIAIDADGNAYVTGVTGSSDFPTSAGAISASGSAPENVFVAKVDALGRLQYSAFFGGTKRDYGTAIAIDSSGAVYIAARNFFASRLHV